MNAGQRFGAVIVNYNCARLSVDAALSFLGAGGGAAVIVDNASPDGSAEEIEAILAGRLAHRCEEPPAPLAGKAPRFASLEAIAPGSLTLIRAPRNGGFAYGCNTGLRSLAQRRSIDRYLLLNPDALLAQDALTQFAARLKDERAGLCGASVVEFEAPHRVQCFGGAELAPLLLIGRNIGEGETMDAAPDRETVERKMSYPLGAAIALRRDYLSRAGYLDERYFLYYEEADWAFAGGPASRPAWAPAAVVYHRYGGASLSRRAMAGQQSERSPLSDFHMTRSRLLFAIKWRPVIAPLAFAAGLAQAAMRLARGRLANALAVAKACLPWTRERQPDVRSAPAE